MVRKLLHKKRKLSVRETISFWRLFFLKIWPRRLKMNGNFCQKLIVLPYFKVMFSRINVTGHVKTMYYKTLHGIASYCMYCILVKVWRQFYFEGVEAC